MNRGVEGWIRLLVAMGVLLLPDLVQANVGPPSSGGQVVAEPVGIQQVEIRWEVLQIDLRPLANSTHFVRKFSPLSPFPAMTRDLNLVVAEAVRWHDLAATVRRSGGEWVEAVEYRETYRDPQKDGADKKRLFFSLTLRSPERTLTSEEADSVRTQVVAACHSEWGAILLG